MIDLDSLAPMLMTIGFFLGLSALGAAQSGVGRPVAAGLCIVLAIRYIWWHGTIGMPSDQDLPEQIWAWTFYFFEVMGIFSASTVYVFMSRTKDRSGEADRHMASPLHAAPVDVFIATYNESAEILERTIIGAVGIDHADLRVFVLDDGTRPWVHDLAAELGAHYVARTERRHAKAGNVNNGLKHALTTGRRPEFVLLLDADFIASKTILNRTLGLFDDPTVGIVQTPQHFFNPDPVQSNLLCTKVWPDEQRFFFEVLLPCKDAWGVAFCCGTSAVFRVAALELTRGLATETVTEDMLTSFKMEEYGYRTIFLNEPLSIGLAPEGLGEYISQRCRWCLGAIQQIYTRWSFIGAARLRLINRFSAIDVLLYWLFSFPFKLFMITSPMIYWWTGASVIVADDLLSWLGPYAAATVMFMSIYTHNRVLPLMTDVTQLLSTIPVISTAFMALIKPWGHPFKVTAKGTSTESITIHWGYLLPYAAVIFGTLAGILINMSSYADINGRTGYVVNLFWSIYNIVFLVLVMAVCIELPRRRRDERFEVDEAAMIRWPCGAEAPCRVSDISVGGARLDNVAADRLGRPEAGTLVLDSGALEVPFEPVRPTGRNALAIRFHPATEVRRALIRKIYSGAHRNKVDEVSVPSVILAMGRKLLT
jgi:cellulose synthase (UDP-forming)